MSQENTEVVKQLKNIKMWIATGAIGFLLIGINVTIFSVSMTQMTSIFDQEY